jgi:arylsulfatase A-like enzyme
MTNIKASMSMNTPLRALLWLAVLSSLAGALIPSTAQAATKPNILLIIADDYGVDSSSLYNTNGSAVLPPTPNIAALAQQGVLFQNGYANPVCSPTRACIITGRYGFRTGVGTAIAGAGSATLASSEWTLPEIITAAGTGHALAQFGKWHLATGPNTPSTIGGWTNFSGSLQGAVTSYTNWTKNVNGVNTANYTNYATTDVVNDAVTWINGRGTNHWFAWVAFNAGHTPLHKPPTNLAPSYASLPGTTMHINSNPELYFHAMIQAMDTEIGRLLGAVSLTNTHVIFIGDNGTSSQTIQPPFVSGQAKGTVYEGGTRVPWIVAGPSVTTPGRTNFTRVHVVDLFATILEMAGTSATAVVPTSVSIDSESLVSTIATEANNPRLIYTEVFDSPSGPNDGRALRDSRYKFIQFADGHDEFFDLQTDPTELNDLNNSLTSEQQAYRDRLQFWLYGYSTNSGVTISNAAMNGAQFSCAVNGLASYELWRCEDLTTQFWSPVTNVVVTTNGSVVTLADPAPTASQAFYSVVR